MGSVRGRTRAEVLGSKSSFRVYGGAVALMLELMSYFSSLPDHAPFSSYRSGKFVRVVRYGRALRAMKELIATSDRNVDVFALHPLRVGGATTLAAGRDVSERVMQREGKWKSDAYKAYSWFNIQDLRRVSRQLVVASEGNETPPEKGQPEVGNGNSSLITSELEESNGMVRFEGLVIRDVCRRQWLGTRLESSRERDGRSVDEIRRSLQEAIGVLVYLAEGRKSLSPKTHKIDNNNAVRRITNKSNMRLDYEFARTRIPSMYVQRTSIGKPILMQSS